MIGAVGKIVRTDMLTNIGKQAFFTGGQPTNGCTLRLSLSMFSSSSWIVSVKSTIFYVSQLIYFST
jgi:hypothetical protein